MYVGGRHKLYPSFMNQGALNKHEFSTLPGMGHGHVEIHKRNVQSAQLKQTSPS